MNRDLPPQPAHSSPAWITGARRWTVPLLAAAALAALWPLHNSAVTFNELDVGIEPGSPPPLTSKPIGGRWEPLAWAALAVEHRLARGHPLGYRVTGAALHAAAAGLLYLLASAVLRKFSARATPVPAVPVSQLPAATSAAVATLLFVVHPLRVDALGWASNQGTIWAAVLLLAVALLYLRPEPRARRAAVACYILSLLFGPSGLLFPFVLPLLDRLAGRAAHWRQRAAWIAPAIVAGGLAVWARLSLAPEQALSWSTLLALAARLFDFNVLHVAVPLNLLPAYEMPTAAWSLGIVTDLLVLAWLAGVALACRRSVLALAGGTYVALLLPGVLRLNAPPALHGALTYMPDLAIAVLLAAGLFRLWLLPAESRAIAVGASIAALLAAGSLGYLSWQRASHWRNQTQLWESAYTARRDALLTLQLARSLHRAEELERAVQLYRPALQLRPDLPPAHAGLIRALLALGRSLEAVTAAGTFVQRYPDLALAHRLLGESLASAGRTADALHAVRRAAERAPRDAEIARLLMRLRLQTDSTAAHASTRPEAQTEAPATRHSNSERPAKE